MKERSQTIIFNNKPYIKGAYSIVGSKENEGPLKEWFDEHMEDDMFNEDTWEKAETKMLKRAVTEVIRKSYKEESEVDAVISGDLLNQLMASSFMARDLKIPFLGIYGACSTMCEALLMGALLTDGRYLSNVVIGASSHYCTAERQFRMPLEHGNQRPPTAQWTVTAAGTMMLSAYPQDKTLKIGSNGNVVELADIRVESATIGRVVDAGIKDANQMGSAMAPAAVDTLITHLNDTGRKINYYDAVFTGDLGFIGKAIAADMLETSGIGKRDIDSIYDDCGAMIYRNSQDVHSGGSGCGCSASVIAGYVYKKMRRRELKRVLVMSTGAMLSTISTQQGETIPGIAHAVSLEAEK